MADAEKIAESIVTGLDRASKNPPIVNRPWLRLEIAKAINEAVDAALERAAKVADIWADTKPVLHASSNPATATAIASIISDTGSKIAAEVRRLKSANPETV